MFRYRRLLVPLDGSALAERAVQTAACTAEVMSSRLHLLRVVPPLPFNDTLDLIELLRQEQERKAIAYLEGVKVNLNSKVSEVKTAVIHGHPAQSIIQYAQDNHIDLIVMSSHGYSGLKRWLLGSVATRVLRKASCSTLIVRAKVTLEPFSQNHFLVPLDGSRLAEQALRPAKALALLTAAEITLINAVFPLDELAHTLHKHRLDLVEFEERIKKKRYLHKIATSLSHKKVPTKAMILTGAVHECILEYAHKHHVDLIIMSSHGRSGIDLWAYGSVTEKVLYGSPCAVLIVRGSNIG